MCGQVLGLHRACVCGHTVPVRGLGLRDSRSSGDLWLAESATPSPSLSPPSHPVSKVWNRLSVGPTCHLSGPSSVSARAPLELLVRTQIEGRYVAFEIFDIPDLKFMICQKKFEDIGYLLAVLLFT